MGGVGHQLHLLYVVILTPQTALHWDKTNPRINCSSLDWSILGFFLLCLIGLWSGPGCCLTCYSVVYEINSDIFPGFRTGNFLFELTSCYPVQVIFIVFARIKLQLQILTRYLVSASGVRFGECLSVVWSLPTSPAGSSRQPVWWWLVVGWQHRAQPGPAWPRHEYSKHSDSHSQPPSHNLHARLGQWRHGATPG